MPCSRSSAPGPMPESCNSCGEPMAPLARITSCRADTIGVLAAHPRFDADRPAPVQAQAGRLSLGDHGQVGPVLNRAQEGLRGVPAHAAFLVDVEVAAALVVAAIEIPGLGDAGLGRGLLKGVEDLPFEAHVLDPPLAARAMQVVGALVEVLGAGEQRQHLVPAPARIAELAPTVVVARLAAHVDHAVDRGAAAQHPATRIVERPAVEAILRLGLEAPVGLGVVLGIEVADRDVNPDVIILAAGFEQADALVRIGREPVGQHAARRTRTHDHVIEFAERRFTPIRHPALLPPTNRRHHYCRNRARLKPRLGPATLPFDILPIQHPNQLSEVAIRSPSPTNATPVKLSNDRRILGRRRKFPAFATNMA